MVFPVTTEGMVTILFSQRLVLGQRLDEADEIALQCLPMRTLRDCRQF